MKSLISIALFILILTGCTPVNPAGGVVQAPTEAPSVLNNPPASTPEVKVVEMATRTPASATFTPTALTTQADTTRPTPTFTPVGLPKTLEELGIPAVTYQDDQAGLAFEYPAGWILNALSGDQTRNALIYTTSLRSGDVARGPKQQEGIPPGMAAIDVTVFNQGPKTLDQAINERRAQATQTEAGQPVQIALEEEWTLRNGLKAHRFFFNIGKEGPGPSGPDRMVSELVSMIHGKMVLVTGMGDQSLFNVIAGSLRELK